MDWTFHCDPESARDFFSIKEELSAQDEAAELRRDLGTSQRSVVDLLTINKEIAKKLSSRKESMTDDQRKQLVAAVKAAVPQKSVILAIGDDREANEYGELMRGILDEAGCLANDNPSHFSAMPAWYGIRIFDDGVGKGRKLQEALTDAQIPDVSLVNGSVFERRDERQLGSHLELQIGPRK